MGQEGSALNIPPRKVVKTLAVGQEVEGVVKRVTEFGAFIDIGVGRDGLVHVSEMAQGRVSKPSDVVKEGDKVQVWIKELDREKNRISLSMVQPGTMTLRDLEEGSTVRGQVSHAWSATAHSLTSGLAAMACSTSKKWAGATSRSRKTSSISAMRSTCR